jgi:acrylyl-CoA reductase (NADPH)
MNNTFKALVINENANGFTKEIQEIKLSDLPQNDLLIKVSYSSVNFKDALSASGNKGVTRKFPHIPGIDAAGTVVESISENFPIGSKVLITGFDLGMNTWGGFGEYISIPEKWAVALPAGLTEKEAMSYGTAGLTAGLSLLLRIREK